MIIFRLNNTLADLAKAIDKSTANNEEMKMDIKEIKSLLLRGGIK